METIRLEVVSGEENLFSGEAVFVVIPTEMGELGVYPKHEPLLGRIRPGVLRIKMPNNEEIPLAISGGVVEIQPGCITVLSDVAVRSENLDAQRAKDARAEAEKRLKGGALDEQSKEAAEAALASAIAQLKTLDYLRHKERK